MAGTLDAPSLRRAMELFLEALREHRDEIDSLNVYPVPDGDTGTNMLLTQRSVVEALPSTDADLPTLGGAIARASLMGAKGNSGVLLAQILRGLVGSLPPSHGTGADLARGLGRAAEQAHRAVERPADGTMLTVIRDAAAAAAARAHAAPAAEGDLGGVANAAVREGRAALDRTREVNPDLRLAGVVDAGGKGVVLLLESIRAAIEGDAVREPIGPLGPVGAHAVREVAPSGFDSAYEVQFLLEVTDGAIATLRTSLGAIGDSVVIAGEAALYSVHVHTNQPGAVLERALVTGRLRATTITYLPAGDDARLDDGRRAAGIPGQICALVAVASGQGVGRALRSLGAIVVEGGPGVVPSIAEIVRAAVAAPAGVVLLVTGDPSVRSTAERAAEMSPREVRLIPARSLPAAIAAAAAFNPVASVGENVGAMGEAASRCRSVQLHRASEDSETPAGPVRAREWVAAIEGRPPMAGDLESVLPSVVRTLVDADSELVSLVAGRGIGEEEVRRAAASLAEAFPALRIEVLSGGQPAPQLVVGIE